MKTVTDGWQRMMLAIWNLRVIFVLAGFIFLLLWVCSGCVEVNSGADLQQLEERFVSRDTLAEILQSMDQQNAKRQQQILDGINKRIQRLEDKPVAMEGGKK